MDVLDILFVTFWGVMIFITLCGIAEKLDKIHKLLKEKDN